VLPFLGPSTARDGVGWLFDTKADVVANLSDVPARNSLYLTRFESTRARLLDTTGVIDEAALDKYDYVRSAWLQRRLSLVYDGNPPRERDDSDDEDAPNSGGASAPPEKKGETK
jgi:phospholipid-binding lipoprotein MlaA